MVDLPTLPVEPSVLRLVHHLVKAAVLTSQEDAALGGPLYRQHGDVI